MILLLYSTVLFYCERWYVHSGGWAGTSIINFSFFFSFFFPPIHTVHDIRPPLTIQYTGDLQASPLYFNCIVYNSDITV
jgi:hypothetical protein